MDFISGQTLLEVCRKEKLPISEVMKQKRDHLRQDAGKRDRRSFMKCCVFMKEAEEPIRQPKKVHGRADRRRGKAGGRTRGTASSVWDSTLGAISCMAVLEATSMGLIVERRDHGSFISIRDTKQVDDEMLLKGVLNGQSDIF